MKDSKALKAAHILKKYCKQHGRTQCANTCIFNQVLPYTCVLQRAPENYNLKDIDQKIYGGQKEE